MKHSLLKKLLLTVSLTFATTACHAYNFIEGFAAAMIFFATSLTHAPNNNSNNQKKYIYEKYDIHKYNGVEVKTGSVYIESDQPFFNNKFEQYQSNFSTSVKSNQNKKINSVESNNKKITSGNGPKVFFGSPFVNKPTNREAAKNVPFIDNSYSNVTSLNLQGDFSILNIIVDDTLSDGECIISSKFSSPSVLQNGILWLIAPDKNATVHTDWPQIDVFTTDINQPRYTASGYKFTLNTEESAVNKITIDGKDVTEKFRILVRCGKLYNGLPYNYGVSIGIDINVPMVNNIDITSLLAEKPCEAIVRMSSAIAVKLDNLSSTESKSVEFKGKFQRPITLSLANGKKLLLGRIESTSDVKVSAATGSELYIESVLGKNMRITGAKDCKIIIDNLILEEYLKARFERNGTLTLHQGSCKEIEFEIFNESKLMFNSLIKTELFKVRVGKKSTLEMTGDVSKTLIKELELDMGKSSFAIFKAAIGCLLQSSLCPGANANISVLDNKPDECETYKNCLIKDGTYQIYNDAEVVDDEY